MKRENFLASHHAKPGAGNLTNCGKGWGADVQETGILSNGKSSLCLNDSKTGYNDSMENKFLSSLPRSPLSRTIFFP